MIPLLILFFITQSIVFYSLDKTNLSIGKVDISVGEVKRSRYNVTTIWENGEKLVLNTSLESIQFYPWNDGIKYKEICSQLKERFDSFEGPPIIFHGYRGGMGHKTLSAVFAIAHALYIKRPLKFYMYNSFWNSTDSCLKTMMITPREFKKLNSTQLRQCGYGQDCRVSNNTMELYNETLVFEDYRVYYVKKEDLPSFQLTNITGCQQFEKIMFRLILNPINWVQEMVLEQLEEYPEEFVTMHIRGGGKLANKKEKGYWIDQTELLSLVSFLNETMEKYDLPHNIYLSTDSDLIEFFLKVSLPYVYFLPRKTVTRSHSTSNALSSAFQGAVFDAFVAAKSKHIFYTYNSMFSRTIMRLGHTTSFFELPTKFRIYETFQ